MKVPSATRYQVCFIIALVLCTYLPFVKQPFHLDDYLYLDVAKNVFRNPRFPQDMPYKFEGQFVPDMASHSHPPFTSYFLAGLMALFHQRSHLSEVGFHLGYLIFPLLLGISSLFLARRFTDAPVLATALLMGTPVVMTMSHIMSPDLIALAFWVTSVTAFVYALDTGRNRWLWLSAAMACLAVSACYQALSIIGLFLLYAVLNRKLDRRAWLVSLAPILLVVGWFVLGYWHYGRFLPAFSVEVGMRRQGWGAERTVEKILGVLIDLGGVTAFPLFILATLSGWKHGRVLGWMGLAAGTITLAVASQYPWWEKGLMVIFLTAGLALFARILARGWSNGRVWYERAPEANQTPAGRADMIFLALWVLGVFAYNITLFFSFAARYMLPMVPPAMLILVNEARARTPRPARGLAAGVAATLILSIIYAVTDYQFASIYPKFTKYLESTYAGPDGWKIWVAGEWGFRYYGEEAGAEILIVDRSVPKGGDFIIVPALASGYPAAQDIETMLIPVEQVSYQPRLPLRLIDRFAHAGFPGVYRGLLPISLSRRPLEEITVKQVSLLVDQLPEAQSSGEDLGAGTYPVIWTLDGEAKLTLQQAINSRLTYRLKIPARAQPAFSLGVVDESPAPGGTLTFSLRVKNKDGTEQTLFRHPVSLPPSRSGWIKETVDLSAYAGQTIDLTLGLATDSPASRIKGLRGGWGNLVLIPQQIQTCWGRRNRQRFAS